MQKRKYTFIPLALIILILPIISVAQGSITLLIKKVQPSTVLIITYDQQGKETGIGSGFFVSSTGDIITNWHVIKGSSSAVIKTTTGAMYKMKDILEGDEEKDLVRITIDATGATFPALSMSKTIPSVGEGVVVVRSPLGLESTVSDSVVSAIRTLPNIGRVIQISAPISPGSSGSPVINLKGQVIGIATFQFNKGQNLNFAIASSVVAGLPRISSRTEMNRSNPILSKISLDVQRQDNEWIRIEETVVIEKKPEEYYKDFGDNAEKLIKMHKESVKRGHSRENFRMLLVTIRFLKYCKATTKESPLGSIIKTDKMNDQQIRDFFDAWGKHLTDMDYHLPRFRCDYRTKVFTTFFSSSGKELRTDGWVPHAWLMDSSSDKRKVEMSPGETTLVIFTIPNDAEYWHAWVSK